MDQQRGTPLRRDEEQHPPGDEPAEVQEACRDGVGTAEVVEQPAGQPLRPDLTLRLVNPLHDALYHPPEILDKGTKPRGLKLKRSAVHHESGRGVHDHIHLLQPVRPQGGTCLDHVHDSICQSGKAGQFNVSCKCDNLCRTAEAPQVLGTGARVFRSYPPNPVRLPARANERQAACRKAEVDGFKQLAARLDEHVLADYAGIGDTQLDVGRHVNVAHLDYQGVPALMTKPAVAAAYIDTQARRLEELDTSFQNAALRQGKS